MIRRACIWAVLLAAAPALAAETPLPVANPGFEGTYTPLPTGGPVTGATAPGWDHNSGYGDTTTVYTRDTTNPHGGSACQLITVKAVRDGNLQLLQGLTVKAGTIVTIGAWLRGAPGAVAHLVVQGGAPSYPQIAGTDFPVQAGWKRITAQGYVTQDDDAAIIISLNAPGTICIDDVTISTRPGKLAPTLGFGPISASFFGVHVSNFQFTRLRNPRFAPPYVPVGQSPSTLTGTMAYDWEDNSAWADVTVNYHPDRTPVPGGSGAQAVDIAAIRDGRQQFAQRLGVLPGLEYVFTAKLRGTPGLPVEMYVQNSQAPYQGYASQWITDLGPEWKTYTVRGGVGQTGLVNLTFASDQVGSYSVADVQFTRADGKPAPPGVRFPPPGFGTLRLWDSDTTWARLEPEPGKWQFGLLDRFVAARSPGQEVILTLGQSPTWASSDPSRETFYGAGATAPPKNLADWTNYIKVVAKRYKGRIKYYEVWNEPNDPTFYSGTVAQIAELTRTASEALKAVDPDAKLITAPAYSPGYLDQYLATGAAQYADIIGYHAYATPPEEAARQLANVRLVLAKRLLTAKPLWDTEGGSGNAETPPAVAKTYMARKYLVDLAFGAANFGWYGWGSATPYAVGTTEFDTRVQTPAAKAFAVVRGWLLGAALTSVRIDKAGSWRLALDLPGGSKGLVLWNPKATTRFSLPAAFRAGTLHDVDGETSKLAANALDLTYAPVMVSTP
jgi:hypothetical protein